MRARSTRAQVADRGRDAARIAGDVWRSTPATLATELSRPLMGDGSRGNPRWIAARHLQLISLALVDVFAGRCRRLVVTLPPRHGKSEIVSHYFPVWALEHLPTFRVLLASYEHQFAETWGRKARDTVLTNSDRLAVRIHPNVAASSRWETPQGGGMVTAGIGGAITGRGADVFVIDDPVKNMQEAQSETERRAAWEWYRSTSRTRLEPGGSIVVVQTRWHEDDLTGRLLNVEHNPKAADWRVIDLPAIAEYAGDVLGREPGDALWPERYDEAELDYTRQEVGAYVWGALYQGHPAPMEGDGLWIRSELQDAVGLYASLRAQDQEPVNERLSDIVVGVDPPGGEKTECGIVVCGKERELHNGQPRGGVLDDRSMAGKPEQWATEVVKAFHDWGADRVAVERNYGGDMVRSTIRNIDPNVPVRDVTATRGKRIRAEPVQIPYTQGRVWHRTEFTALHNEQVRWHPDAGFSPNRLDAMVWAMTDLNLAATLARVVGRDLWG